MPSTITHEYYYRDVYERTDKNFKKQYAKSFYLKYSSFAQGHDAFFFLDFFNVLKQKEHFFKASILQDQYFQDICLEVIKVSREYNLDDSKELRLFLYGYMMHHLLDSRAHPYIIYETENFKNHEEVETYFDFVFINQKEKEDARKYPVHKIIPKIPEIDSQVIDVLSISFASIYQFKDFGKEYIRALKQIQLFLYLFRYDPMGIKKIGYQAIERFLFFKRPISWLSYHNQFANFSSYLNEERRCWNNPVDENQVFHSSFLEIYEEAVDYGAKIISRLESALNDYETMENLRKIIPDVSAIHGKKCNQNLSLSYVKK